MPLDLKKNAAPREMALVSILAVALVYLLYQYFYVPFAGKSAVQSQELKTLTFEKEALNATNTKLKSQKQLKQMQRGDPSSHIRIQILDGHKKTDIASVNTLIKILLDPSFHQSVHIEALATKPAVPRQNFRETPLTITARGPFNDVIAFLDKMDNLPALITNEALFLNREPDAPGIMSFGLVTNFYEVEGLQISAK